MKRSGRSKSSRQGSAASPADSASTRGGHSATPLESARPSSPWAIAVPAALLVLATLAAYSNSLHCSLLYDDNFDIIANKSIRHLWPIWDVFVVQDAGGGGLHGRPVVNLSLAINYAIGGLDPFGYHLTNLVVHLLAGLCLFGIVRRTLLLPGLTERFAAAATPLALAVALIWTLHPLQTESVTYLIQRFESMMGLFYLLTLYAAIRCATSLHPRRWAIAAVLASLLAMGCKEVAVSIPLVILLYDRAFLAGSFRAAWSRRRAMYFGLAATWAAFALLFMFSYSRGKWAGYALPVSWIEYARTQFSVILHYLRLSFWPRPLILDYSWPVARTLAEILPAAVVIGGLVAATIWALVRWPKWGLLGAWFFLILAPTSTVMPLADLAVEHRMYLPLAAVAAAVVIGGWMAGQWLVARGTIRASSLPALAATPVIFAAVALGTLTFHRNMDYQNGLSIWGDTVAKSPHSSRAHNNFGTVLADSGRLEEAMPHFQIAFELKPDFAEPYYNLGFALAHRGRVDEAIAQYRQALAIRPDYADASNNLGLALAATGRTDEALACYEQALKLSPNVPNLHNNMGSVLVNCGKADEALLHFRTAVELNPDYAAARKNLDAAIGRQGKAK